ncbi:PDR/VanB family oxidoreductase [Subtercola endophyticus]|uniref:PDR/VanB family oxidoreductase n=1 Tax=Subtercola endophyticus TaxID=2895559 RepID=UPI001E2D27DD|nr:PDR/VanB family oxidoreductase [Subtercola endophyticus]UFS58670.1 PDR/VanB family oxidoreductase [Subtercola endophyticus]
MQARTTQATTTPPAGTTVATNAEVAARLVTVTGRRQESSRVVSLTVRATGGGLLPEWQPGAHVAVEIPDGSVRHYSLSGWPGQRNEYRIAVLHEPDGRGGSTYLAENVAVGDTLTLRQTANHFALTPASEYLFIAGGIGITPLLPMIYAAEAQGKPWRLVYYGSSREHMAFLSELAVFGDRVEIVAKDEAPAASTRVEALVESVAPSTQVYLCGPQRLLDAAREAMATQGTAGRLRFELFEAPDAAAEAVDDGSFEVHLQTSDLTVTVGPEQSILEAVREVGIDVLSDCEEGICGSCETAVVSGEVDHRDYVLTQQEKDENRCLMICVSRAACPILTLAL